MNFKPTIGLEIHAELLTKHKMFCRCENAFGGESNTRICPVCTGFPGSLPFLNPEAVELAVKAGLVLGCEIQGVSAFDRKNYSYPDLPKAYQITQQFMPICKNGVLETKNTKVRINNIHLEEDAAKLIHSKSRTVIDYNRCGVPLIEIVTEPDFRSANDASQFVEELIVRLKYADVCDGRIEQGSLRVDVNISVADKSATTLGTRCEIKNIGSLKSMRKAIEFEIKRQCEILNNGGVVECETRRFDEASGETYFMRKKESPEDYRYFPEPDIPEVHLSESQIEKIKLNLPRLPSERILNYIISFGLTDEEAINITSDRHYADWFEEVCINTRYPKKAASLMLGGLNRLFNKYGGSICETKLTPCCVAELAELWGNGKLSSGSAFVILEKMFLSGGNPREIAEGENLFISFDREHVKNIIFEILDKNQKAIDEYKSGNKKVFGFLMGLVISGSEKNTNPVEIKKVLEECLDKLI